MIGPVSLSADLHRPSSSADWISDRHGDLHSSRPGCVALPSDDVERFLDKAPWASVVRLRSALVCFLGCHYSLCQGLIRVGGANDEANELSPQSLAGAVRSLSRARVRTSHRR
uniref:Uncharacterized protein n=1 Tax=Plectus sambesii TaxID=2011161 RepID=A0A914VGZ3_9BILA